MGSFSGLLYLSLHATEEHLTEDIRKDLFVLEKYISTSDMLTSQKMEEKQPFKIPDEVHPDSVNSALKLTQEDSRHLTFRMNN